MFFLVATIISVLVLCSTTDVRDKDNKTPLHWACEGGNTDVVQYLVEQLKMDVGEYFSLISTAHSQFLLASCCMPSSLHTPLMVLSIVCFDSSQLIRHSPIQCM